MSSLRQPLPQHTFFFFFVEPVPKTPPAHTLKRFVPFTCTTPLGSGPVIAVTVTGSWHWGGAHPVAPFEASPDDIGGYLALPKTTRDN